MNAYYLDSSALAKRYLMESGSRWLRSLVDPLVGNAILTSELTRVEVSAALAARQRAPAGITRNQRDSAVRLLILHCTSEYMLIPVSVAVLDRALLLTQTHRLRGYDAVQLATALIVNTSNQAASLPALTFVSADADLVTAAQMEGLSAENPNSH